MTVETVFTKIPNRGLITLSGHDSMDFLQGLITNDITLLNTQNSIYACLLTPNGKFLFDFFIIRDSEHILIECEGGVRAEALLKRLQMFKLRKDVSFSLETEQDVYSLNNSIEKAEHITYQDTRHTGMGYRSLKKPSSGKEETFRNLDIKRIKLGIPDGSRDMIPEKSTLLECNIDKFNGINFEKGCYMGQELTARMHYRGLTKKTLVPLEFTNTPPSPMSDLNDKDGRYIGEMRSSAGLYGLALLKKSNLSFSSGEYKLYS